MTVLVGDDWAEAHRYVYLMNENGDKLAVSGVPEGLEGIAAFRALVADHANDPSQRCLSVSSYRDPHTVAGANSDPRDANVLADLVRTDRHNHRPVAGDSGCRRDQGPRSGLSKPDLGLDPPHQPAPQRSPRVLSRGPGCL